MHNVYYTSVDCNPLTPLLRSVPDMLYKLFLRCCAAVGRILADTSCCAYVADVVAYVSLSPSVTPYTSLFCLSTLVYLQYLHVYLQCRSTLSTSVLITFSLLNTLIRITISYHIISGICSAPITKRTQATGALQKSATASSSAPVIISHHILIS